MKERFQFTWYDGWGREERKKAEERGRNQDECQTNLFIAIFKISYHSLSWLGDHATDRGDEEKEQSGGKCEWKDEQKNHPKSNAIQHWTLKGRRARIMTINPFGTDREREKWWMRIETRRGYVKYTLYSTPWYVMHKFTMLISARYCCTINDQICDPVYI